MINVSTRMVRVDGLNLRQVTITHEGTGLSWRGYSFEFAQKTAKDELVKLVMGGLTDPPVTNKKKANLLELAQVYREVEQLKEGAV